MKTRSSFESRNKNNNICKEKINDIKKQDLLDGDSDKKIVFTLKLELVAGDETLRQPLAPALFSVGVNIIDFIKQFNAETENIKGDIVKVILTVYEDHSFTFIVKSPITPFLIKKAIGIEKGSSIPGKNIVGYLSKEQIEKIAKIKMPDLNTKDLSKAVKIISGTARSMGVGFHDCN
uniref:50S ribosomal protein L11 n=1 Tax=viral metagenome TaxID=1070528 RepID=A0A6C0F505_9ZZZZ